MTAQVRALGYGVTSLHGDEAVADWWELEDQPMWDIGHLGVHFPADVGGLWRRFSEEWGRPEPDRHTARAFSSLRTSFTRNCGARSPSTSAESPCPSTSRSTRSVAISLPDGRRPCGMNSRARGSGGRRTGAWTSAARSRLLRHVELGLYDLVCKVHTKKSPYDPSAGAEWRRELLRALFDDLAAVFSAFGDRRVIGDAVEPRPTSSDLMTVNRDRRASRSLSPKLGLDHGLLDGQFVMGTMFWCRPFVFQALKDAGLDQAEFPAGYTRDGTLAHAVERIFGVRPGVLPRRDRRPLIRIGRETCARPGRLSQRRNQGSRTGPRTIVSLGRGAQPVPPAQGTPLPPFYCRSCRGYYQGLSHTSSLSAPADSRPVPRLGRGSQGGWRRSQVRSV